MGRYTGPTCRLCRRIGEHLYLKGESCYTSKCPLERKRGGPGGTNVRRRRLSDWALQLREKQKARFIYGILEKQFRKYFEMARDNPGVTGDNLLQLLETRLDNVVYRLAFAETRQQARQLVNHGHFTVNGRRMDIPSYLVKPGDVIAWKRGGGNGSEPQFIQDLTSGSPRNAVPLWLRIADDKRSGEVMALPDPSETGTNIDVRLVVEFYSK